MGKRYARQLTELVEEVAGRDLRAYVNPGGLRPTYHEHVVHTLQAAGCEMAADRTMAILVVEGYTTPAQLAPGQVCVVLDDGQLLALNRSGLPSASELQDCGGPGANEMRITAASGDRAGQ